MDKFTDRQIERVMNWLNGYCKNESKTLADRFKEAFQQDTIEKALKIVYIAHPVAGDVKGNTEKIIAILRHINLNHDHVIPFAPYIGDVLALNDNQPIERVLGIRNCLATINSGIIDELWIYGPRISGGMHTEIDHAYELGIPIIVMDPKTEVPIHLRVIMKKGY